MDDKISSKLVDRYADEAAQRLVRSFFSHKQKIAGREILQLTPSKQINLFIIKDLLKAWKEEANKFRSPYFDYSSEDVQSALVNFQNILSNHILIAKDDFLPLVVGAIKQTVTLILSPYEFYSIALDGEMILTSDLKNDVKYIKINQAPLERLVNKLEEKQLASISGNEAFALLDQILEEVNFTPEEIEPHLQVLNGISALKLEDLYEQQKIASPIITPTTEKVVVERKILTETQPSVKENKTLADDLARKKTFRLKENLTINQKFMFTKILFHGDFEIFTEAIEKIDRMDKIEQALRYLDDSFDHWNKESDEYLEFLEVLERRFN